MRNKIFLGEKQKSSTPDDRSASCLQPDSQRMTRESVRKVKTSLSTRRRAFLAAQHGDSKEETKSAGDTNCETCTSRIKVRSVRKPASAHPEAMQTAQLARGAREEPATTPARVHSADKKNIDDVQASESGKVSELAMESQMPQAKPRKLRLSRIERFKGRTAGGEPVNPSQSPPLRKVSVRRVRRSVRTAEPKKGQ